jgi:O-methyltransferase
MGAKIVPVKGTGRLRAAVHALRGSSKAAIPTDLPGSFLTLYRAAAPYTMTSVERMYALYEAVAYIERASIPGDIVECGVWRGGSSLMAGLTLDRLGATRRLWLYDTFEGMPPPGEEDAHHAGEHARDRLVPGERRPGARNEWAWAPLDDVRSTMALTRQADIEYVVGKVEETIPEQAPERIAILRLDTDWYESTAHELEHLWPRLSPGGVLIIDDYGHWQGARRAVDEYFASRPILLSRLDYTGRLATRSGSAVD